MGWNLDLSDVAAALIFALSAARDHHILLIPIAERQPVQKKGPGLPGPFFASASLFSSTAHFRNNKNDQRNKSNHQKNAPHHASLKNTFYNRTTAQTKSQKTSEVKNT
jgi:hypothetical protein